MVARGGARPGAGRPRGPSKATLEKVLIAERAIVTAQAFGKKLAKDILDDFMQLFAGMAAAYQPLPPNVVASEGRKPDEAKFVKYGRLAIECAKELAQYQSPTFRAVVVAQANDLSDFDRLADTELLAQIRRDAFALGLPAPDDETQH